MNDMIIFFIIILKLIELESIQVPTTSSSFDLVISFPNDDKIDKTDSETISVGVISAFIDISLSFSSIFSF